MKIKYIFPVESDIRLNDHWPIFFGNYKYEFFTEEYKLYKISVEIDHNNQEHWPSISTTERDGLKVLSSINTGQHQHLPFIQTDLLVLQGLIAIHAIRFNIDFENYKIEWLPENKAEQEALAMPYIKASSVPRTMRAFDFDLLARSIYSMGEANNLEIPLSFFKHGQTAFDDELYIQAYYNYFFVLEYLFGEGKFKRIELQESFLKSDILVQAVKSERSIFLEHFKGTKNNFYILIQNNATTKEVLWELINLRGLLHHQNPKNKKSWNPNQPHHHQAEVEYLRYICYSIVFNLSKHITFSEDKSIKYFKDSEMIGAIITAEVHFQFSEEDGKKHNSTMNITVPGTIFTHKSAEYVAEKFYETFNEKSPHYNLIDYKIYSKENMKLIAEYKNLIDPI